VEGEWEEEVEVEMGWRVRPRSSIVPIDGADVGSIVVYIV